MVKVSQPIPAPQGRRAPVPYRGGPPRGLPPPQELGRSWRVLTKESLIQRHPRLAVLLGGLGLYGVLLIGHTADKVPLLNKALDVPAAVGHTLRHDGRVCVDSVKPAPAFPDTTLAKTTATTEDDSKLLFHFFSYCLSKKGLQHDDAGKIRAEVTMKFDDKRAVDLWKANLTIGQSLYLPASPYAFVANLSKEECAEDYDHIQAKIHSSAHALANSQVTAADILATKDVPLTSMEHTSDTSAAVVRTAISCALAGTANQTTP